MNLGDLSVVVPTLNAARHLPACLGALAGSGAEVVVVDGGSADGSVALARELGARVIAAPRGRGGQLAAGVAAGRGTWRLLLHADTRLGPDWLAVARAFMDDPRNAERAGYFRFVLDSPHPSARRLERAVAWRCRALGLPYGDQGLLIARAFLERLGGVRPLALMEDVDLVRRIGRRRLVPLQAAAITSAERWERDGWRRRSARNLACLALYFCGIPPERLGRLYG